MKATLQATFISLLLSCSSLIIVKAEIRGRKLKNDRKGGGGGGGEGRGGGGKNGAAIQIQPGHCEICSRQNRNRPGSITLEYRELGVDSIYQDSTKASCVGMIYPSSTSLTVNQQLFQVQDGTVFTVQSSQGRFGAELDFYFGDGFACNIHTSCSVPLVAGDQIGPFLVLGGGTNCQPDTTGINPTNPGGTGNPQPDINDNDGLCEICSKNNKNSKPSSLTLTYNPDGVNSLYQDASKASCRARDYPDNAIVATVNKRGREKEFSLSDGATFTIYGPFQANTKFTFDNGFECTVHLSCSVPLVAGDQIGPFMVRPDGNTCYALTQGQPDNPQGPGIGADGSCEICSKSNKRKPDSLTLMYRADGVNSRYQDSSKASCRADNYPTSATIRMSNKDGERQTFSVQDGSTFIIEGKFRASTVFQFDNGASCSIHTSCSVPIVVGDQIGPFVVVAGNDCEAGGPPPPFPAPTPQVGITPGVPTARPPNRVIGPNPPTPFPTPAFPPFSPDCLQSTAASYNCGDEIEVEFDFDDPLPDDWIGIYPCSTSVFSHAAVWQWSCGSSGCRNAVFAGSVVFDSLPSYNSFGPHEWPVRPFRRPDGSINRCFKAVLLRNDGPSVPPYIPICESAPFEIFENNGIAECAVSDGFLNCEFC